nr:MAG TPA: hypothetical protein [Bacteriophage sp.]
MSIGLSYTHLLINSSFFLLLVRWHTHGDSNPGDIIESDVS